jgi:hypothetical protein
MGLTLSLDKETKRETLPAYGIETVASKFTELAIPNALSSNRLIDCMIYSLFNNLFKRHILCTVE